MTPPCCKNCEYATRSGTCRANGTDCARWRKWFRMEWTEIQRAAKILRANDKEAVKDDKGRTETVPKHKN